MNAMGCTFIVLTAVALMVGFIPILTWINLVIALPLAVTSAVMAGASARRNNAQPADRALFWIAAALGAVVVLREVML